MEINSVYILPHPPELLSVFSDRQPSGFAHTTQEQYFKVLKEISEAKPQSLIIIQSLGGIYPDGMTFYAPDSGSYIAEMSDVGHPEQSYPVAFDAELARQIQKSLLDFERKQYVQNQQQLPLPSLIICDALKQVGAELPRLVVLGVSLEGADRHYEYGSLIARALKSDQSPSALICTGQLSHCLTKQSVAGYVPSGKQYDKQVLKQLEQQAYDKLMATDPFLVQEVGEDLFRPLVTGLGILDAKNSAPHWEKLSYEAPQGIGYLVGRLRR